VPPLYYIPSLNPTPPVLKFLSFAYSLHCQLPSIMLSMQAMLAMHTHIHLTHNFLLSYLLITLFLIGTTIDFKSALLPTKSFPLAVPYKATPKVVFYGKHISTKFYLIYSSTLPLMNATFMFPIIMAPNLYSYVVKLMTLLSLVPPTLPSLPSPTLLLVPLSNSLAKIPFPLTIWASSPHSMVLA
jgi:hypothetical protein